MEKFIQRITKEAGKAVFKKFGKVGVKYTKTDQADVVTAADLAANRILIRSIKKAYPTHGIISEETGEYHSDAEYCWVIDPIDGTRNFATGTPLFAVMVSLIRNGVVEMATIYNPCTKEFFFAKKGKGTYCNGKRVHCSEQKLWKGSWGSGSVRMSNRYIQSLQKLLNHSKKEPSWVSGFGSIGVDAMYIASGRRDWRFSKNAGVWDYSAPYLILKESGCVVTNFKGEPWTINDHEMVAGNKYLHKILLGILN